VSKPSSDHDFLFGLLALLNGLVNQGQLVAAFQAWTLDKSRPLAEHQVSPRGPRGGRSPGGGSPRGAPPQEAWGRRGEEPGRGFGGQVHA